MRLLSLLQEMLREQDIGCRHYRRLVDPENGDWTCLLCKAEGERDGDYIPLVQK